MGSVVGGRATRLVGGRTVMSPDTRTHNYLVPAIAAALAALFIYAGAGKVRDPLQFADAIAAFAILPATVINMLALSLPVFEIACGLLLLVPQTRKIGTLAVALSSLIFFAALLSALVRGLTLDCGCFGSGAPSRPRMWLELGLDVVLFSSSLFAYCRLLGRDNNVTLSASGSPSRIGA
jgi:putative oxidoreductase